jgi:hypothetical protein
MDEDEVWNNEKEWRRHILKKLDSIESEFISFSREITAIKVWNTVFRLVAGALFTIILVWIEVKLNS